MLLGPRVDYLGDGTTVRDFDASLVSLPPVQSPVPLASVLGPEAGRALEEFDTRILADDSVVAERLQDGLPSGYFDAKLRSDSQVY